MGCEKINNAHVLADLAFETLGRDYGPFGALFESFAHSFQNEEADDRAAVGLFILSTAAIYLEFAQPYYGLLDNGLVVVVDITPPPPSPPSPSPSPPRRSSWACDAILVDIDTTSTKFDRRIDGWVFGTGRGADRVEWLMARSPTQLFGPRLWKAAKSLVIADNGAPRGRVWCGECFSCKGVAGYQGPNPPKIMCKACTADAAALALIMAEDSKKTSTKKKKNRCGTKIKKSNQWTKKKTVVAASPVLPLRALPTPPPEPLKWVEDLVTHAVAATTASAYLDWLAGAVAAVAVARGVHSRREMDALGFVCY